MPKKKGVYGHDVTATTNNTVSSPSENATETQIESKTNFNPAMFAQSPAENVERDFDSTDVDRLAENEHFRYLKNSNRVGHALITKKDGKEIAAQFAIPAGTQGETPAIRPLINIESIDRFKLHRYRAQTPNGTVMYATRYIDLEVGKEDPQKYQIACFSPSAKPGEPFWGAKDQETPVFKSNLSKKKKQELEKELNEIPLKIKGGEPLVIEHASVQMRDLMKSRNPTQNVVMGESAVNAYETFLDAMMDELHPDMKKRLKRAIEAPLHGAFYSNYRPEWLHGEGFSLTPMAKDPQVSGNLGAAPKWANTEMMVLERIVKWFAMNRPHSYLTIKPHLECY